jgi:hypothetical protein
MAIVPLSPIGSPRDQVCDDRTFQEPMLIFRPRATMVVPLGGIVILALLVLGFVSSLPAGGGWLQYLVPGLLGALALYHIVHSWLWVGARGDELRWWSLLRRGAAPLAKCRLHSRLLTSSARGGTLVLELLPGRAEPVKLASFSAVQLTSFEETADAKVRRIAERLGLPLVEKGESD